MNDALTRYNFKVGGQVVVRGWPPTLDSARNELLQQYGDRLALVVKA